MTKIKPKNKYLALAADTRHPQTLAKAIASAKEEASYGRTMTVYELVPVRTFTVSVTEVKHK